MCNTPFPSCWSVRVDFVLKDIVLLFSPQVSDIANRAGLFGMLSMYIMFACMVDSRHWQTIVRTSG